MRSEGKTSQRKPGNREWTIQRNKKHWVSKGTTQQTDGTVNYKQSRDIGNIGHTRHRRTTIKAKEQHSKQKGQSSIDNPEKQETLGTQDTEGRQTTQKTQHRKLNTRAKRTLPNPGVNTGVREGYAVPVSYKTPTMLLIQSIRVGRHYAQIILFSTV